MSTEFGSINLNDKNGCKTFCRLAVTPITWGLFLKSQKLTLKTVFYLIIFI